MSMKNKLFHILLCLLLVLSLVPAAAAATLDTADFQISGNTVIIGSGNAAVLEELDSQEKTVKIAVPYTQAEVFVVKDGTSIVPHNWAKTGFIQFEVFLKRTKRETTTVRFGGGRGERIIRWRRRHACRTAFVANGISTKTGARYRYFSNFARFAIIFSFVRFLWVL